MPARGFSFRCGAGRWPTFSGQRQHGADLVYDQTIRRWGMVTEFAKSAQLGAIAISAICLLFVIIMRVFGFSD